MKKHNNISIETFSMLMEKISYKERIKLIETICNDITITFLNVGVYCDKSIHIRNNVFPNIHFHINVSGDIYEISNDKGVMHYCNVIDDEIISEGYNNPLTEFMYCSMYNKVESIFNNYKY